MARRSGTEKRKRPKTYSIRFSQEEAQQARIMADRTGLSVASLVRRALFNTPPPRAVRRPTVNHKAVAQLLGQLAKIGTNINQLAKQANAGRFQSNSIELAMRDLMELRTACLQSLGREPNNDKDDL